MPSHLPFYNPLDPLQPKTWPDYTLVLPICAVGNIGQLACDLIISTLLHKQECQLVGRIYSPSLMSVVGPNAFSLDGPPTTSSEVYQDKAHKVVIIQQRTTYFRDLRDVYIQELVQWIKECKFQRVLVLTSSFAQCNPDTSQLGDQFASPIRTLSTSSFDKTDPRWLAANLKELPDRKTIKVVQDGLSFLPGSGLTKPLLKALERVFVPAAFLVDFCSEGINIPDCYEVVNVVGKLLNFDSPDLGLCKMSISDRQVQGDHSNSHWIEPYSWRVW